MGHDERRAMGMRSWIAALGSALVAAAMLGGPAVGPVAGAQADLESGSPPAEISGPRFVIDVATAPSGTCAIRADGSIACWGDSLFTDTAPPDGTFVALDLDWGGACAIRSTGGLACWGGEQSIDPEPLHGSFQAVTVGSGHGCALRTDGTVACWGSDEYGEASPPDGDFTEISAGSFSTCGILESGLLTCWGGSPEYDEPAPVPTADTVIALDQSCVVRTGGSIWCWDTSTEAWSSPIDGTFMSLSGTCGIRLDGTIDCWGDEDDEYLGPPPDGTFVHLSASYDHACALRSDQQLECWGIDWQGQVTPRPRASIDVEPWRLDRVASVTWRGSEVFVPVASYDVRYKSARWDGRYGDWTTIRTATTETSLTMPTARGHTYCFSVRARDEDGRTSAWTDSAWVEGYLEAGCTVRPVDVGRLTPSDGWRTVRNERFYAGTALRSTESGARLTLTAKAQWIALVATTCPTCGSVRVSFTPWTRPITVGLTSPTKREGQLIPVWSEEQTIWNGTLDIRVVGDGRPVTIEGILSTRAFAAPLWADASDPPTPATWSGPADVSAISAGMHHTCAVMADGSPACWGDDSESQSSAPLDTFMQVAAADDKSCGLRRDGSVVCWGMDHPYSSDSPIRQPVGAFTTIAGGYVICGLRDDGSAACDDGWLQEDRPGPYVAIDANGFRACAITSEASIECWDMDGRDRAGPAGAFTALAVGPAHACAVRTDTSVVCWGNNEFGKATPPTGSFSAVSAGSAFTCGLRVDATVDCWGDGHYGQLEAPSGTFSAIDAGGRHACAIGTSGTLACWGQDRSHQVTPRPTATLAYLPTFATTSSIDVSWWGASLEEVTTFDVRYRPQRQGTRPGAWVAWKTATGATSGSLALPAGRDTCVRVRAHDAAGGVSPWSNTECTSAPYDDVSLGRSGRWAALRDDAYYRGTALRTRQAGAWVRRERVPGWAELWLVATTCPGCGSVKVTWPYGRRTISLESATVEHRQVLRIRRFDDESPLQPESVTIKVTSSDRKVVIDGLIVAGWGDGRP